MNITAVPASTTSSSKSTLKSTSSSRGRWQIISNLCSRIPGIVWVSVSTVLGLPLVGVNSENTNKQQITDAVLNSSEACNDTNLTQLNGYNISCYGYSSKFWLSFDPPSRMTFYTLGILDTIIDFIGLFGNVFVLHMFVRCKSLRTSANMLVINLVVCDILMILKCPIAIYNNFMEGPALGDYACRLYGFIRMLSGTAAIGTLTAIAFDRYKVVVHPLTKLRDKSILRPNVLIVLIWIYSFAFSLIPVLDIGISAYVPEGYMTTCSFDYLNKSMNSRVYIFVFFVADWVLPLFTIAYCYFHILQSAFASAHIQSNKRNYKSEHRLTIIIFAIMALWFCAWTPYTIVALMAVFGYEQHLTPMTAMAAALLCKIAACLDPYLYVANHPRFCIEFDRFLRGKSPLRGEFNIHGLFVAYTSVEIVPVKLVLTGSVIEKQ